jgi:predicted house-cleaning noncanonical NTP pyrophosphatase (MazG superfamily)
VLLVVTCYFHYKNVDEFADRFTALTRLPDTVVWNVMCMEIVAKKRKKPSYMTDVNAPDMRVMTTNVMEMVEYLHNLRNELDETGCEYSIDDSLEKQVARVVDATSLPFYNDTEELSVYQELRESAVDVERGVSSFMTGRDTKKMRHCMPLERWNIYEEIREKAGELSTVGGYHVIEQM